MQIWLDFADVEMVFAGATFTFEDDRFEYNEDRYIMFGLLRAAVVVIAHTEREEVIRVISMRKATKNEQQVYRKIIAGHTSVSAYCGHDTANADSRSVPESGLIV